MIVWTTLVGWWCWLLEWFDGHEGSAGWLQAFFSILAIWIALSTAKRDRLRERQEVIEGIIAMLKHAAWIAGEVVDGTSEYRVAEKKITRALLEKGEAMKRHLDEVSLIQIRPAKFVMVFVTAQNEFEEVLSHVRGMLAAGIGNVLVAELLDINHKVNTRHQQIQFGAWLMSHASLASGGVSGGACRAFGGGSPDAAKTLSHLTDKRE